MNFDSDNERGLASVSRGSHKCEAKRLEVNRIREQLDKVRAGEDDEVSLLLNAPLGTTDPLSCLCLCGFKRLGNSYILYERREVSADGNVETKMIIVGPHWIGVLVTLGIILVSTGMFLYQQYDGMSWVYVAITLWLCSMTLYYLFWTTCSDPGIVRPKQKDLALDETEVSQLEAGDLQKFSPNEVGDAAGSARRRRRRRRRYCDICDIEQERYTDHCEDCGVCVAGYDHHCPWMGKCIGRDNMYAFKMFNVSWVAYVTFVLFVAIVSADWGEVAAQGIQTLHRTATGSWVTVPT